MNIKKKCPTCDQQQTRLLSLTSRVQETEYKNFIRLKKESLYEKFVEGFLG